MSEETQGSWNGYCNTAVMRPPFFDVSGGLPESNNAIYLLLPDKLVLMADPWEILISILPGSNKVVHYFPDREIVREVLL